MVQLWDTHSVVSFGSGKESSFDEFCKRFEVSPRESEVIMEICNGLSNKEISDKLFISLQTVKDHTHHILKPMSGAGFS